MEMSDQFHAPASLTSVLTGCVSQLVWTRWLIEISQFPPGIEPRSPVTLPTELYGSVHTVHTPQSAASGYQLQWGKPNRKHAYYELESDFSHL